jgi:antitoxin (DNA-binding transcriptional repressor) of toxin-antitoxin stability system
MKKANVSQTKNRLSSLLEDVKRGETILIFDRDRLIARIEPIKNMDMPDSDRITALAKTGVATAPRDLFDVESFLGLPRPRVKAGSSASGAVVQERSDGR